MSLYLYILYLDDVNVYGVVGILVIVDIRLYFFISDVFVIIYDIDIMNDIFLIEIVLYKFF